MKSRALISKNVPLSTIHSVMSGQGFALVGIGGESAKYRAALRDASTESVYWLEIPLEQYLENPDYAKLGQPYLSGEKRIPPAVLEAAESKLNEMADYLKTKIVKIENYRQQHVHRNGSMAADEHELKRLGKEMESLETGRELSKENEVPDPIQYEEKQYET